MISSGVDDMLAVGLMSEGKRRKVLDLFSPGAWKACAELSSCRVLCNTFLLTLSHTPFRSILTLTFHTQA